MVVLKLLALFKRRKLKMKTIKIKYLSDKIEKLKYIDGYKHELIAEKMHCHPRTITRKHKVALHKLSAIMKRVN